VGPRRERVSWAAVMNWTTRHPLITYFALAYGLAWALAVPLALSAQGLLRLRLPRALHYLTLFAPLLAAFATEALTRGRPGLADLIRRMRRWRVGWTWALVALSPLALYGLAAVFAFVRTGGAPGIAALGHVNFLPPLGLAALLFWVFTAGLGEETGWRGFALPRLQARHSALGASVLLGLLWAGWHLPYFFYLPGYVVLGAAGAPGFVMSLLAGAVLLTWVYNGSRGSILAVAVWHGAFNYVTASAAAADLVAMVASIAVMVWAVLIVVLCGPARLSRGEKQAITTAAHPLS
jgi:membrane protease YdiL (CAAX protease family)